MEILFILVPVGLYIIVGLLMAHRVRTAKFIERADLPFEDIYREHFENAGISMATAEELWSEAATTLKIPAGKLRPQDSFDRELAHRLSWFPFVDLNDDFYWAAVARLRKAKGENSILESAKTLGEYVIAFGKLHN